MDYGIIIYKYLRSHALILTGESITKYVYVHGVVLIGTDIVIVELHVGLHEDGLNEQDPPPGKPRHERVTG